MMATAPSSTARQGSNQHIAEDSSQTHNVYHLQQLQSETLCINGETRDNDTCTMEVEAYPFFSTADEFPFASDPGLQQMEVSAFSSLRSVLGTSPDSHAFDIKPHQPIAIEQGTAIVPLQAPSFAIGSPTGDMTYQHAAPAYTAPSATMLSGLATPHASETIDAVTFARLLISQQPSLASCSAPVLDLPFLDESSLSPVYKHTSSSDTSSPTSYSSPHLRPVRSSTAKPPSSSRNSLVEKTPRRSRRISSSSSFTQHFSDLNIDMTYTSTSPSSTTNSDASSASSLSSTPSKPSSSIVYFPPTASALHQKRRKDKRQALRAPRPRNCFMLYRSKVLPQIMVELGTINNKIISKIAAERWRAEKEEVKAWYRMMAKRGKEEHARNNPGYKYAPYKKQMMAEMRKAHSGQVTSTTCEHRGADEENYSAFKVGNGQGLATGLFNKESMVSWEPTTSDTQVQTSPSKKVNAATRLLNVLKGKSPHSTSRSPAERSQINEPTSSGLSLKLSSLLQPFSNTILNPWAQSTVSNGAPLVSFASRTGLIEQQLYHTSQQKNQGHQTYPPHQNADKLYNLVDANSSSVTLVDPLQNQWLQQRYHEPSTLTDYLGLATQQQQQWAQTFSQMKEPSSNASPFAVAYPCLSLQPITSPLPLLEKSGYSLDKDLPPLPGRPFTHSGDNQVIAGPAEQDYQSIMAQLFASYNGGVNSSLAISSAQTGFCLDQNDGMWPNHHQMQPLQQMHLFQQQQLSQQHPYLIKPSSPQFLSFADLLQSREHTHGLPRQPQHGQDPSSMSLVDLFSWPPLE